MEKIVMLEDFGFSNKEMNASCDVGVFSMAFNSHLSPSWQICGGIVVNALAGPSGFPFL